MTWTNAFDAGEMTVVVGSFYDSAYHEAFRAIMDKGDTRFFSIADLAKDYTISVSDDGVVTLSGTQFDAGGGDLSVQIIPTESSLGDFRLSGITLDLGTAGTTNAVTAGNFDDGPFIDLAGSGSAWTPDPSELASGSSVMAIEAEAVGV